MKKKQRTAKHEDEKAPAAAANGAEGQGASAAASGAEEEGAPAAAASGADCEEVASAAAASGVAAKGVPGVERIAQRNSSNDHGPIRMTRARVVVDLACVLVAFA